MRNAQLRGAKLRLYYCHVACPVGADIIRPQQGYARALALPTFGEGARRAGVDDINQPYTAPAARTERRNGVPYSANLLKHTIIFDVTASEALREDEETDENGSFRTEDSIGIRCRTDEALPVADEARR